MKRTPSAGILAATCLLSAACHQPQPTRAAQSPADRGKYLVTVGGRNDCHTPWKLGENSPEPNMSRMLSGHLETMKFPPPPTLPRGQCGGRSRL